MENDKLEVLKKIDDLREEKKPLTALIQENVKKRKIILDEIKRLKIKSKGIKMVLPKLKTKEELDKEAIQEEAELAKMIDGE